ncbi:MAG TPA: hypothetical protein VKV40_15920 [Ktedonobacteraceae bacterium]|nr:hypothetical protein [Ktedonobacteraceae bacterium]
MITFAIHGYEGVNPAGGFGPLRAEFEKRGFPCRIFLSTRQRIYRSTPGQQTKMTNQGRVTFKIEATKTPNQDRAKFMVEALRDVEGEIALIGVSNQGLFMPLVAAARPIRRIVMINAVIPHPGQSFIKGSKGERVWAHFLTGFIARRAIGMNEVCPLTELPKVEYVYICGEKDDAIRPEWEQWAARQYLHVEPVVIKGAGHANIVLDYVGEVVDAAIKGL